MPSWPAAIWRITTWRTRRARTCAGGWAGPPKLDPPTRAHWTSRGRSPSGAFLSDGWENWDKKVNSLSKSSGAKRLLLETGNKPINKRYQYEILDDDDPTRLPT